MSGDVGAEVAAALAAHTGSERGELWAWVVKCYCGHDTPVRPHPGDAWDLHRSHQATALAPLIAERVEAAKAEALLGFVDWVATNRAYNGSNHPHGQSLYNECINAELPKWARAWIEATP